MNTELECGRCGDTFKTGDEMIAHLEDSHNLTEAEAKSLYSELFENRQPEDRNQESDQGDDPAFSDEPYVSQRKKEDVSPTDGSTEDFIINSAETDSAAEATSASAETRDENPGSGSTDDGTSDTRADSTDDGPSVDGKLDSPEDNQAKWFIFGVGGCGGNLVDSIILRYETVKENGSGIHEGWERATRGLTAANTNTNRELYQTYYVQEYREDDAQTVTGGLKIGFKPGGGAYWKIGEELANWTFNKNDDDFAGDFWGPSADHRRILDAQAVLFLHSAVKGTGTGATPIIAEELDAAEGEPEVELDMVDPTTPKFSLSVLPSSDCDDIEKTNGLIGFANLAQTMDAIIPVDNENLGNAPNSVSVSIEGTEGYQVHNHRKENGILVSFLETFTFASVGGGRESAIQGEGFDPQDAYVPARTMLPVDSSPGDEPAIVMAPAYGTTKTGTDGFTRNELHNLMTNTLTEGKLVDFDHTTAWGGSFVFEAPLDQDQQVKNVCEENFDDLIQKSEHLNIDPHSDQGKQATPSRNYFVFRRDIDEVRLWALLYNPEMPRLERWRNWASEQQGGPERYQSDLGERWKKIEDVFSRLGRQKRPGS